uniref:Uncharacterized protein n=1 Tax=Lepeophtheirus salmonis TaxID=72036 RepID=A0A0K2TJ35_LEPSM
MFAGPLFIDDIRSLLPKTRVVYTLILLKIIYFHILDSTIRTSEYMGGVNVLEDFFIPLYDRQQT